MYMLYNVYNVKYKHKEIGMRHLTASETVETRLEISSICISGTSGEPLYQGIGDLSTFEVFGVEAAGFWSRAWKNSYGGKSYSGQNSMLEDVSSVVNEAVVNRFQEIVLAACETVAEDPSITEQEPGYLLQRATWVAQNKRRRLDQTYMVKTHGLSQIDIDAEIEHDEGSSTLAEALPDQRKDFSDDMRLSVQQMVSELHGTRREIAVMLMDGLSQVAIAEHLGVSKAAISYHVKKLRAHFAELMN